MTGKTQRTKPQDRTVFRKRAEDPIAEDPAAQVQEVDGHGLQRAMADPAAATPGDILALQQAAGNRAINRLIQTKLTVGAAGDRYEQEADRVADQVVGKQQAASDGRRTVQRQEEEEEIQAKPVAASITRVIQRQAEEEEEIQTKPLVQRQAEEEEEIQTKPLVQRQAEEEEEIQTKPLVQRQAEEEEEIQTKPLVQRQAEEEEEIQTKPLVQRQAEEEEEIQTKPQMQLRNDGSFEAGNEIEDRLAAQKGGGSPLPGDTRAFMEGRFGADFSGVRVHTGSEAANLNRSLSAQAFTHGQDIYLGQGKYDPGSEEGKHLLAHELTHTIQQTGGQSPGGPSTQPVQISAQRAPGVQRKFDVDKFYRSFGDMSEEEQENAVVALLKKWSGAWTRKKTRRQYVALLMKGAVERGYEAVVSIVQDNYATYYPKELPPDYEDLPSTVPELPEKMESGQRLQELEEQLEGYKKSKATWEGRLKDQSWQDYLFHDFEGEAEEVIKAIGGLKERGTLSGELGFSGTLEKELTSEQLGLGLTAKTGAFGGLRGKGQGKLTKGKTSISGSGEGEFLAGVQQQGEVTLTLDNKYAKAITQLEEEVKLGSWGEGSGQFSLGLSGLSASAKAYLAIGGQTTLKGKFDAQTKKGGMGLLLDGQGTAFAGAEAGGEAEFSASLTKGIAAAVKAKAFAGVKAEATGKCMFKLLGRPIFGVEGTAGVSYGAGGELEATMKIPIFGNTEFGFKANGTLGLGSSAGAKVLVNMGNVALSAKEIWLKLKNLPTTMQGYESSLTMQDQEVLQKLQKLITVYEGAIKQTQDRIRAFEKKPTEKQSLLL